MSESYVIDRRTIRGTDLYTDISRLPDTILRDSKNLTIDGGVVKTRPGSNRYGINEFSLTGTPRALHCISTAQGEWCLVHVNSRIRAGLATSALAGYIQNTSGLDLIVPDTYHPSRKPFVPLGYEFNSSGDLILKVLFRNRAGCKVLEYNGTTSTWLARDPSIGSGTSYFSLATAAISNQEAGRYRIRVVPARVVSGVRVAEGAAFARSSSLTDKPYQEIEIITAGDSIRITITHSGLSVDVTHWVVEATRPIVFASGTDFSVNGNDPTIFYEVSLTAKSGGATTVIDLNFNNISTPKTDTRNFLPIPGHELSVFSGGTLFFAGISGNQSRIFAAGADGVSTHSEMYNPALYVPADESDTKAITDLAIIGDHLGVWKENKTGILISRNIDSPVVWRDRHIGAPAMGCVTVMSESLAVVLCHDGQIRLFDGSSYDHNKTILDTEAPISEPMRTITEGLVSGATSLVSFVWHREKLHLLYTSSGARKALVLFPRDGFGWMPWDGLTHELNALAENETKWIYLETSDSFLYEQSPIAGASKDRGTINISWSRHDAPIWPQSRLNSMNFERIFLEGIFDTLTKARFRFNESETITALVGTSPDSGTPEQAYRRWYELFAPEGTEMQARCLEVLTEGIGPSTQRALVISVNESAELGIPFTPSVRQDIFANLSPQFARMVAHLRFDTLVTTQPDYSGNGRDVVWTGGAYISLPTSIPYGGVLAASGGTNGFVSASWNGMDYIGDVAGACSLPQTFEYVFSKQTPGVIAYLENANRGGDTWQVRILANESIVVELFTTGASQRRWAWATPAGFYNIASSAASPFILQITLFDTGNQVKIWGSKASSSLIEATVTRTVGFSSGYGGLWSVGALSDIRISHLRRMARIREESEARNFHNWIKGLA